MNSLRVVLVEPQIPANIGFVARILANFEVSDWVIVNPPKWENTEAEKTGSAALETLKGMRSVDSLAEALLGTTHAIGFSARQGRHRQPQPLPELATSMADLESALIALVFGREDRGLETIEADACSQLCLIPTLGLPSLNLSHAVAIALYEFCKHRSTPIDLPSWVWAPEEDRQRVAQKVAELLEQSAYPDRGGDWPSALIRLATLPIEARDLRLIEKALKHALR
ncbi:MAG: RNA methyltransferase [Planctomycetes bacterium]|nr:RNA methyltransferase [Planctomycetota bacterium]